MTDPSALSQKGASDSSPAPKREKGEVAAQLESQRELRPRKSIQSVEIGVRILESLVSSDTGRAPLREIASKAGMSRSQAHRYLLSYINTGMVVQEGHAGLYALGPTALKIGLSAAARLDVIQSATDELQRLVEVVGSTGVLSIWGDHGPTLVRWVEGRQPVVTSLNIGSILPLQTSSVGIVFLAFQSPAKVAIVLQAQGAAGRAIDDQEVAKRVRKAREDGYATAAGDLIPGLCAITAPVFDMRGWPAASIGVLGYARDQNFLTESNIRSTTEAARRASLAIGWTPGIGSAISRTETPDFVSA